MTRQNYSFDFQLYLHLEYLYFYEDQKSLVQRNFLKQILTVFGFHVLLLFIAMSKELKRKT